MEKKSPARELYDGWMSYVRLYNQNPDFDARLDEMVAAGQGQPPSPFSYRKGVIRPQLNRYFEVAPYDYCGERAVGMFHRLIQRQRGTNTPPIFGVTESGKFMLNWNWKLGYKHISTHTFLGYYQWRGKSLLAVRPLHGSGWGWDPWDINVRHPYFTADVLRPRYCYNLYLDGRGFWRVGLSAEDNPEIPVSVIEGAPRAELDDSYAHCDRLYASRRRKKFREAGITDPETQRPLIVQRPDALAKAFVTYRPAPAIFPERMPLEATHG